MKASTNRKSTVDEGSLDQYLRDISVFPLISREEEVSLAQRIRESDQEALDKLVRSNLRFVVSVAKKYQNQGVSLSDLINEGNLGLIRAAHKFDETKGIKFISYAVFCLKKKKATGHSHECWGARPACGRSRCATYAVSAPPWRPHC